MNVIYLSIRPYIIVKITLDIQNAQPSLYCIGTDRRLHQARAYLVYFEACILLSQGPNAKTCGMPSDQHKCAYARADVCIAYSVVAKYVPQLCIKCGIAKSCPGTHTALQARMGTDQDLSCLTRLMTAIMGYDSHREPVRYNLVHWGNHESH